MEKLKTHQQVINAIEQGFKSENVKWCQAKYIDRQTKSEEFPCGTSFCLLGAIATSFNSELKWYLCMEGMVEEFISKDIADTWANIFAEGNRRYALMTAKKVLDMENYKYLIEVLEKKHPDLISQIKLDYPELS